MAITTDLSGKTAIITGSNSGIGLGIAQELAKAGADVVLNSFTDREEDHALAAEIAAGDRRHGALHQGRHVEGRRMPRADRARPAPAIS
jgi:NAD(P)-dependent dehydrogenase (short-subunit alcohol dehydrogenase family)